MSARLLILSDLHLEFGPFTPPDPELYDVAVLAGDIAVGLKAVHWAQRASTLAGKPVVLVPGNHEFYGSERTRMLEMLRKQAAGSNVHLLDRDEVTLNGVRFLGATLWTDFELMVDRGTSAPEAMRHATRGLNDFAGSIRERVAGRKNISLFAPSDALREHRLSRSWLLQRLEQPVVRGEVDAAAAARVVVTHHAPSERSRDAIYDGSALNPCFYSELPPSFFGVAALWIHGHTHSSSDYQRGGTRVLANPRGYVQWSGTVENKAFQSDLIVEVGGANAG